MSSEHLSMYSRCLSSLKVNFNFMKQGKDGLSLGFCLVSVACVVAELQAASVF